MPVDPNIQTPAPSWLIYAIIGGFLIIFPLIWCFVLWILSLGGWRQLAKTFAAGNLPVTGERHSGLNGMIGAVSYRGVITVHLNEEGFFMEVMAIFKVCHPRLFIPWSEIKSRQPVRILWWKSVKLTVGDPQVATVTLPEDLFALPLPATQG